ncbi:MAG: hypothetical protein UX44_C0014G0005 [candidate division WWE3 bacterium GW2011_GWA1_46_21]|uniref:Uncharacterized protein n=3 Tax=Katanobacteria TaxID=422282 RepID=A0A0G1SBU3_UNCKA|nr:MAG: hypothetical protein UX44_C0014G0005 [candidate division WWE3 bacterium GW2011_GWA1_46_21]KKU49375.1 MAG: hypothetical protein UX69_C0003G0027 [candidate division WWE3 bacterium GW2011_GWA2_46_9]KKU57934.1 MAG: hypothetical protein UX79_C0003G0004 [candidate division WWE3 bacterium GW2011_GWB1_47_11]
MTCIVGLKDSETRTVLMGADSRSTFGSDGPAKDFNLEQVLLDTLVPALKELARKREYLREKDKMPDLDGTVLIAFGDQLCIVSSDFHVTPVSGEFWAIGSGQLLALGSLASTEKFLLPKVRVRMALKVAATFDAFVAPPFVIRETDPLLT